VIEAMATAPATRAEIEDLLFLEAALLDEWRLDEWLALWTESAKYVIPTHDNPDADPERDLVYVNHDHRLLRGLITRLESTRAHREYPWSKTRHLVSNVRILEQSDGRVIAEAAFAVWRYRNDDRDCYVGRYDYELARLPEGLRISTKRVTLDAVTLAPMGAISIIL
jgi:p-cumate 2,3-dioxygenase beta subunit